MELIKQLSILLITIFLFSKCVESKNSDSVESESIINHHKTTFVQQIDEIRSNPVSGNNSTTRYHKVDSMIITAEGIYYKSVIKSNKSMNREFEFPTTSSQIGKKRIYNKNNTTSSMELIDKKSFKCDGQQITVFKYYYDRMLSSDEESLKFYCDELGLFHEKFRVSTIFQTANCNSIDPLIISQINSAIKSDSVFYNNKRVVLE